MRAARAEAEKAGLVAPAAEMSDDALRVFSGDDEIVVVVEFADGDPQPDHVAASERDFILARITHKGDRCTGISSDALTLYGLLDSAPEPTLRQYPCDREDLGACWRTYDMAPAHVQAKMRPVLDKFSGHIRDKFSGRSQS
jgi:hypothetical protein